MKLISPIFGILNILFALTAMAEPADLKWTQIVLPVGRQASQVEAGFAMGCELTSMFYSLKFGPPDWRSAYSKIPGNTDIQKIQALAKTFVSIPSRFSKGQPAFSEQYGMNPNDVSWMMSKLIQNGETLKMAKYFAGPEAESLEKHRLLLNFQYDLSKSLSLGKPVIMDLTFSNPAFSHAVVILGVNNSITQNNALGIRILDPMTGKVSEANLNVESVQFDSMKIFALSFSDRDVVDRKGTVLSAHI